MSKLHTEVQSVHTHRLDDDDLSEGWRHSNNGGFGSESVERVCDDLESREVDRERRCRLRVTSMVRTKLNLKTLFATKTMEVTQSQHLHARSTSLLSRSSPTRSYDSEPKLALFEWR